MIIANKGCQIVVKQSHARDAQRSNLNDSMLGRGRVKVSIMSYTKSIFDLPTKLNARGEAGMWCCQRRITGTML